jgi:hypothetical protein
MQRMPFIAIGKAFVALPPGAFLQATAAGEEALAARVCALAAGASPTFFPALAHLRCALRSLQSSAPSILTKQRWQLSRKPQLPRRYERS